MSAEFSWVPMTADAIIAIACFLAGGALAYSSIRKSGSLTSQVVVSLIAFLTIACGFAHLLGVWSGLNGQYGFQTLIKVVSAATALTVAVGALPVLRRLRGPENHIRPNTSELAEAKVKLQQETERRQQSEEQSVQLQSELAWYGRLTTVGQMATGLAHELNQPLLAISASTDTAIQVAKTVPVTDPVLYECLDDIQKDTHRAGEIIRTLRHFVTEKSTERGSVDVEKLVDQAVQLVSSDARNADIELVVKSQNVPTIKANSVQIAQVLVNLLRNAVQAIAASQACASTRQKNRVTIESGYDGSEVTVSVKDTGPGICGMSDPFAAFESNKPDGMGVGLSMSREIVEAHGGELRYSSNQPTGASFTFNIPVLPA